MLIVIIFVTETLSIAVGMLVGYRLCQRRGAQWLVRPHTERSMARMPLPEQAPDPDTLVVSEATWVRGKME